MFGFFNKSDRIQWHFIESIVLNNQTKLNLITQKLEKMMKTLDEVLAAVQEANTVDDSIITLLTSIKTQLDEVLSGSNLPPAVQAKVDAIFDAVEAGKQKVADAVTANTPSA